jgi:hypothetical protein
MLVNRFYKQKTIRYSFGNLDPDQCLAEIINAVQNADEALQYTR